MAYERTDNALHNAQIQTLYSSPYDYLKSTSPRSKSPERRGVHWSAKLVEVLYFDPNATKDDSLIQLSTKSKLKYSFYDVASRYLRDDSAMFMRKGLSFVPNEMNCRSYAIQEQVEEWV